MAMTIIFQAVLVPLCVVSALVCVGFRKNLEVKRLKARDYQLQWESDLAKTHEAIKAFRY